MANEFRKMTGNPILRKVNSLHHLFSWTHMMKIILKHFRIILLIKCTIVVEKRTNDFSTGHGAPYDHFRRISLNMGCSTGIGFGSKPAVVFINNAGKIKISLVRKVNLRTFHTVRCTADLNISTSCDTLSTLFIAFLDRTSIISWFLFANKDDGRSVRSRSSTESLSRNLSYISLIVVSIEVFNKSKKRPTFYLDIGNDTFEQ